VLQQHSQRLLRAFCARSQRVLTDPACTAGAALLLLLLPCVWCVRWRPVFACAMALDRNPATGKAMVDAGWEVS
jgi:hypothetical protein